MSMLVLNDGLDNPLQTSQHLQNYIKLQTDLDNVIGHYQLHISLLDVVVK